MSLDNTNHLSCIEVLSLHSCRHKSWNSNNTLHKMNYEIKKDKEYFSKTLYHILIGSFVIIHLIFLRARAKSIV